MVRIIKYEAINFKFICGVCFLLSTYAPTAVFSSYNELYYNFVTAAHRPSYSYYVMTIPSRDSKCIKLKDAIDACQWAELFISVERLSVTVWLVDPMVVVG